MTAYQASLRTLLLASAMRATPTGCLGAPPDDTDGTPPADHAPRAHGPGDRAILRA